ncbi:unnamed protein product [Owenia fusiformis]|uniref:alcohol dehydrogenase n=1 Tax=Owenia fusiformis TaxID=6347 RepID=A0A8J1XTP5_OWEFU|nr:unnamed protein product [Owenia fusiformis]
MTAMSQTKAPKEGVTAAATRIVFFGSEKHPPLLVENCALPQIKDGEILAKILMATICGSDIHTIQGKRREATPSVLGHEAVAEIVESRRLDENLQVGDRITFSVGDYCQTCDRCKCNLPNKCRELFKYGHASLNDGTGFNGCYASHIVLRARTHVAKIPPHVTNKMAAPINCALATMVNATRAIPEASISSHSRSAVIQGAGQLGLYGCALLRNAGYDPVYCTDINLDRLSAVQAFGGTPVFSGSPNYLRKSVVELGSQVINGKPENDSIDVVIEVCGAPSVIPDGINLLRPGGVYIFVGMVHPDSRLNITGEQIIRKCLTIKGVHNYSPKDLDLAVEFLTKTADKYPYEKMIGPQYSISGIHDAIKHSISQTYCRIPLVP